MDLIYRIPPGSSIAATSALPRSHWGASGCIALETRFQPAIYESRSTNPLTCKFRLRRPGKSCKRIGIGAAAIIRVRFDHDDAQEDRTVVKLFFTIAGLPAGRDNTHRLAPLIHVPSAVAPTPPDTIRGH